ncbi:G5 and 3D domain-containing protein [Bacillus sp. OV322]|uniref:G5 and 3D domain-containing protein n=1 Tax=Bacillus sp. OV322 TaxID=1882764 RepID=UPI000B8197FA|nr:G5 and 3D domain-containing protein [Bacillus sp. OV322]
MKNLIPKSFGKKRVAFGAGAAIAGIAVLGLLYYQGTKQTVSLSLDGEKKVVRTHAETIRDILKDFEIDVKAQDYLSPSGKSKVGDHTNVVWEPAMHIGITVDGKKKMVWTTAETVSGLLKEQNLELKEKDRISPAPDTRLQEKMDIAIEKAFPLTLAVGKNEKQVWSTSTTVADFLRQQGVTLNHLDRVEPKLGEKVQAKNRVNVIRVEKVTDVVEEPVNYAVITKKDNSLLKGKEKVITPGSKGLLAKHYEITKENGKVVAKKLLSKQVITEKRDRVTAIGTRQYIVQASRKAQESGGREVYVSSTAYTASCNGCSGRTATGINLKENPGARVIAVDPSVIPLGSKVFVEGYGYAIAADKGSAIKGNRIDVFFSSQSDAYRWGVKRVKVRIIQ